MVIGSYYGDWVLLWWCFNVTSIGIPENYSQKSGSYYGGWVLFWWVLLWGRPVLANYSTKWNRFLSVKVIPHPIVGSMCEFSARDWPWRWLLAVLPRRTAFRLHRSTFGRKQERRNIVPCGDRGHRRTGVLPRRALWHTDREFFARYQKERRRRNTILSGEPIPLIISNEGNS